MKTRRLLLPLAVLLGASSALAQFDFLNKLKDAVQSNKATPANASQNDTVAAVAQMGRGLAGIGPEEEHVIGDSVALEIVGRYGGLLRDARVTRYVNLLGRTLARYSGRPDLNWRFGVLNSDSVNAFSAPDGWVFITRGLYSLARNSDALAGILGHEISHITNRDALKIVARGTFLSGAANFFVSRSSDARNIQGQLQQFDLGIGQIANTLFEKGFDPQTEFAADHDGHDLAETTGYAGGGLRSVLVYLERHGGDSKQVFSTHPPLRERIKRLPDQPAPRL
jgi:predicted Zn-dependent protease